MNASILMPIDPSTDKPTRVSSAVVDGRRVRVARKSRTVIAAGSGKAEGKPEKAQKAAKASASGKKE